MGRRKSHPSSGKFNSTIIHRNGLSCPYCSAEADERKLALCNLNEGWRIGRLGEHVKRCHGSNRGCQWCGEGWHRITNKEAEEMFDAHITKCEWKKRGVQNPGAKYKQTRMSLEQSKKVAKIGKLDREENLEKLYEILGVPIPECYRKSKLDPNVKPLGSTDFLQGFQKPGPDINAHLPTTGIAPSDLMQNNAMEQLNRPFAIAGASAAEDNRDSGLGSSIDEPIDFFSDAMQYTHPAAFSNYGTEIDDDDLRFTGATFGEFT